MQRRIAGRFCLCIDALLERLEWEPASVGCFIGNNCIACDIWLVAPSFYTTNVLLSVYEQFGVEHVVKFNSAKSRTTVCIW
jgi:hypothetical protein